MKKTGKSRALWVWLGLLLCLVSIIGTKGFMSGFGRTKIQNVKIITESGFGLSMDVYIPQNATAETPAPVVLVQHGGNNCKEEVRHYTLELARRGYVAVGVDMYGHGESQALPDSQWLTAGRGLYDAVKYAATLPFVDADRVSLVGYSRGGKAASEALEQDNKEANLIKNIYIIFSDPIYRNADGYTDAYGARNIMLIADRYDEFFFSEKADDTGVYSNDANKYAQNLTSPADFINNKSAQSFLHFGTDPEGQEKRQAETVYDKAYENGAAGTRMISITNQTHMDGWYSPLIMSSMLRFFDRVDPGPVPLSPDDQVYSIVNIFALVGIAGLLIFLVSALVCLARRTRAFGEIDMGVPEMARITDKKGVLWFWCVQAVAVLVSLLIIMMLNKLGMSAYRDSVFRSANPVYHGLICILCGSLNLILCVIWYQFYGKKHGFDLKKAGLFPGGRRLLVTALAAIVAVGLFYLIIFATRFLFYTNYRFVYWGFMPFTANRIPGMLTVLPLYTLFYTVMSVSVNCFNYSSVLGGRKWLNALAMAFLAGLPTLLVIGYVYGSFRATGWNPMFGGLASAATAVYALPAIVFAFVLVSRKIYEKTGNPYLGGFTSGLITSIISWTVCEIRVPEAGAPFTMSGKFILLLALSIIASAACALYFRKNKPGER